MHGNERYHIAGSRGIFTNIKLTVSSKAWRMHGELCPKTEALMTVIQYRVPNTLNYRK
jgi:hypothetical protein